MSKEELNKFVVDYENEQIKIFEELEGAINEVDLSSETKEHLIELMYKDINILFGFVEKNLCSYCKGSDSDD